jgi:hypothetical protein
MSRIETGLSRLRERRNETMGETVTYTRAAGGSVQLTATAGRSGLTREGDGNFRIDADAQEWIVMANDLQVAGVGEFLPARGDTIAASDANYTVFGEGGADVYRYCDATRKTMRVMTKRAS